MSVQWQHDPRRRPHPPARHRGRRGNPPAGWAADRLTGDATAAIRALNTDATLAPRANHAPAVEAPPGFVLERELGVGGMGVVYLAHQFGLNRPVALKLVKDARVDSKALNREVREQAVFGQTNWTGMGGLIQSDGRVL